MESINLTVKSLQPEEKRITLKKVDKGNTT